MNERAVVAALQVNVGPVAPGVLGTGRAGRRRADRPVEQIAKRKHDEDQRHNHGDDGHSAVGDAQGPSPEPDMAPGGARLDRRLPRHYLRHRGLIPPDGAAAVAWTRQLSSPVTSAASSKSITRS